MIDTDKKKYIAELCASVYGSRPRDVVPFQICEMGSSDYVKKGIFFVMTNVSGLAGTVVEFECRGVAFKFNSTLAQAGTGYNMLSFDYMNGGFICDKMIFDNVSNHNFLVTGYQCIM